MRAAAPPSAGSREVNIEDREHLLTLLVGRNRLLDMIATGKPLSETLDAVCCLVEETFPGSLASILLTDRNAENVWHGAAPTLPKAYTSVIDGARADPAYGPCGLAAQGQEVVAADIASDTRWCAEYRQLALQHGLRACWANPIKGLSGKVVGVFEIYLGQPGDASARQKDWFDPLALLASIAIEQAQAMPGDVAGDMLKALKRSEARYLRAMEAAGDGHSEWNLETGEFYVSPRLLEICGYPPDTTFRSREEWIRSFPIHPEDRANWESMNAAHLAGREERFSMEVRIIVRGETRWIAISSLCARDASGRALFWTSSKTDITERKRAADALRASEARFRNLTELSSDWFWEQDENLRFANLSYQANFLTGYSGQSSIGKTRWELEGISLMSGSWEEHKAALAARKPFRDLELRRVATDGRVWYLTVSGAPIFDAQGRFKGYMGVGRNITESKGIEEELRSRQEMLDLAQRSAGAVPWQWRFGVDCEHNRWSPELEDLFGVPTGSFDGTSAAWRKLLHPDDWPRVKAAIKASYETGDVDVEYRIPQVGGSVKWLRQKGRTVMGEDGKPARSIGFMFDVTDRHKSEEELARLEKQLRLAQRLESMGTLAGGIAHDFNNILGAILGYGEMALRDAPRGSRLRRDLDNIVIAGERGRALVDRILAFSRSGVAEHVAVNVESVVREALHLLEAKLSKRIRLEANLRSGRAAVLGDATQVHQVLMNLGTNAVQAMPSGGTLSVSLEAIRTERRPATIGDVTAGEYVVLTVADTGTGIPREIADRIFDPFFTTKEVGTGTGLGLSLVHGIVAELGGAIEVASTPGEGSRFTVYLPRSGDAEEAIDASADEGPPMPRGDGQHVLIVDDEEPLGSVAARTLKGLGYLATTYTSSTAALTAFRAEPGTYDAVLTDERMPGMSGTALIREMRRIHTSIPILLMSGFLGTEVARRAREAGADEVLKKPLSARDLAMAVARVLRRSG
jgi:PAS domain S-box-containing protein